MRASLLRRQPPTFAISRMPVPPTPPAHSASELSWETTLWESVGHLQTLIRLDTVNPPGNEISVARYLDDVLRGAGIETWLDEPATGRASLIARIRGTGAERPILLMAHMDVVGVEREKWTMQPFGGEILDGRIHGRGAIDDKGMLAANLQVMLIVRRAIEAGAPPPSRDIVFLATSDEETGGIFGIDWVLANRRELIDAEFALNEGGRVRVVDGRTLYCAVQCAEKVPHNVVVTARGPGGHAAIPLADNAIARLARAVATIAAHREPLELSPITRTFFSQLSAVWPDRAVRRAMADICADDARLAERGARALRRIPSFDAVVRNGISPTLVAGGTRSNVIPTEATATLNVRTLPGNAIEALVERLRAVVDDPDVAMHVRSSGGDAPPSPLDSPMYEAIAEEVRALEPGAITVPYLSTGATDSAALRRAGIACYGLLPFPLTQEEEDRMHGHDERLGVEALGFGVRLVTGVVARVARASIAAP